MQYFNLKQSIPEIDSLYRQLSLSLHPDRNPSPNATNEFKEMSNEYQEIKAIKKHWSEISNNLPPRIQYIDRVVEKIVDRPIYIESENKGQDWVSLARNAAQIIKDGSEIIKDVRILKNSFKEKKKKRSRPIQS